MKGKLVDMGPRPHGRGGFKGASPEKELLMGVPAHTGGVDLRRVDPRIYIKRQAVPAHTGGVDLRLNYLEQMGPEGASPPTRAGWI